MVTLMIKNIYGNSSVKEFQTRKQAEEYVERIAWSEELKSHTIIEG